MSDFRDNQWHDMFLHQMEDGDFAMFSTLEELGNFPKLYKTPIEGTDQYKAQFEEVKYNWNKGQPIVKTHKCTLTIVDNERLGFGLYSGGFKVLSNQ